MIITALLLHSFLLSLGLLTVLSLKKFRTPPNIMLHYLLLTIVVYLGNKFLQKAGIDVDTFKFITDSIEFTAAPSIYFYTYSIIRGKIPSLKLIQPHLIIPTFVFISTILTSIINIGILTQTLNYIIITLHILTSLFYPIAVLYKLGQFYQLKSYNFIKIFSFNKEKTLMLQLVATMMMIYGCTVIPREIVTNFFPSHIQYVEIINLTFFIALSYLIMYHLIAYPQSIHYDIRKFSLCNFNKYSRSSLQEQDAKSLAKRINYLFETEKPYLNPQINLKTVSKRLDIPPHHITEILNGLLGQNFNEYVNNYRVEEFKSLVLDPKYKNFSLLAIAFEVGFRSKATFNTTFKKFTNQTPSEFKKSVMDTSDQIVKTQ